MASRQLKIKTGVVNRLFKEEKAYRAEAASQAAKLEGLAPGKAEEWDIQNAKKVLADTQKMIPDSQQRLARAVEDLKAMIEAQGEELAGAEELAKAREALATVEASP